MLRCIDALLSLHLRRLVMDGITVLLKFFLRFAVRVQRRRISTIVGGCRHRLRQQEESARQVIIAAQMQAQAAKRKSDEANAAKVCWSCN